MRIRRSKLGAGRFGLDYILATYPKARNQNGEGKITMVDTCSDMVYGLLRGYVVGRIYATRENALHYIVDNGAMLTLSDSNKIWNLAEPDADDFQRAHGYFKGQKAVSGNPEFRLANLELRDVPGRRFGTGYSELVVDTATRTMSAKGVVDPIKLTDDNQALVERIFSADYEVIMEHLSAVGVEQIRIKVYHPTSVNKMIGKAKFIAHPVLAYCNENELVIDATGDARLMLQNGHPDGMGREHLSSRKLRRAYIKKK